MLGLSAETCPETMETGSAPVKRSESNRPFGRPRYRRRRRLGRAFGGGYVRTRLLFRQMYPAPSPYVCVTGETDETGEKPGGMYGSFGVDARNTSPPVSPGALAPVDGGERALTGRLLPLP